MSYVLNLQMFCDVHGCRRSLDGGNTTKISVLRRSARSWGWHTIQASADVPITRDICDQCWAKGER